MSVMNHEGGEGAWVGGDVVRDAPVHGGWAGYEPAGDVQPVGLGDVHVPFTVGGFTVLECGQQVRPPGGGLGHQPAPVLLRVGAGPGHRLPVPLRVPPLPLCVDGVAEVEGDLAEHLEARLGHQHHPRLLHLDGALGHLGEPLQPADLPRQLPLSGPQVIQGVRLGIREDLGDLVQGKAQFPVEEDLLEPCEVGVRVAAVAGWTAVAGCEQPRLVVVVERAYGHPGNSRDPTNGVAHGSPWTCPFVRSQPQP